MDSQWHSNGTPVASQWHSKGFTVASQWHPIGTPLASYRHSTAMWGWGEGSWEERRDGSRGLFLFICFIIIFLNCLGGTKILIFHWFYKLSLKRKPQKHDIGTPKIIGFSLVLQGFWRKQSHLKHSLLGEKPYKTNEKPMVLGVPISCFWGFLFKESL